MPSHFATGWGAFHRSAPVGGAAYGTPRKILTSPLAPVVPEIDPLSRRTGSGTAAGTETVSEHRGHRNQQSVHKILQDDARRGEYGNGAGRCQRMVLLTTMDTKDTKDTKKKTYRA
jgi:hypothetical protein